MQGPVLEAEEGEKVRDRRLGQGLKDLKEAELRRRKKKVFCEFSLLASRMRADAGCGDLTQTGLAGNFLWVNPLSFLKCCPAHPSLKLSVFG